MKNFTGILQAFLNSVDTKPGAPAIYITEEPGKETVITYEALFRLAGSAAAGYEAAGLKKNDRVVIAAGASPAFFAAYIGAWFHGVLPLVVAPLKKNEQGEAGRARVENWARRCGASLVLLPANDDASWAFPVKNIHRLTEAEPVAPKHLRLDDSAHLQGTSGSTSEPKIAVVRHKHIAANVLGIGTAIQHRQEDSLTSWLPFSHDMGLIGLSYALGWQCPFIVADTSVFIQNPLNWLYLLSRHKSTLSPAPNAAFQACARLAKLRPVNDLDLSAWRVALCGSEPVSAKTIRNFAGVFAASGYSPQTMLPVYGLAEATLAVTIPQPGQLPVITSFNKEALQTTGVALETNGNEPGSIEAVSLGRPITGHEIRVMLKDGSVAGEGQTGEVQVKGPSVIDTLWNDAAATARLFTRDGFLHTGDTGFTWNGELYISGRQKDIIIIGGRNFLPSVFEQTALEALAPFGVVTAAAIGIYDERSATEFLHLLAEERKKLDAAAKTRAEAALAEAMKQQHQVTGIFIHWLQKGDIPHTTSGKVQRYLCREMVIDSFKKKSA